jgi:DNA-binding response OmpR family regulator
MSKKILIIDDEADTRAFLEALLTDNGYQTATAADGDLGISKAKEFKPDLVTLDIIMPNQTGVKFYRELSKDKMLSKTPVIILSGVTRYKELFARDHATMPKPFAFVEKPLDKQELLDKIKKALD